MKEQSHSKFWASLHTLHQAAIAGGCTEAQFTRAVEIIGDDPKKVAAYLERQKFFVPRGIVSQF
jgi:Protein of unknown function (DUF3606)